MLYRGTFPVPGLQCGYRHGAKQQTTLLPCFPCSARPQLVSLGAVPGQQPAHPRHTGLQTEGRQEAKASSKSTCLFPGASAGSYLSVPHSPPAEGSLDLSVHIS